LDNFKFKLRLLAAISRVVRMVWCWVWGDIYRRICRWESKTSVAEWVGNRLEISLLWEIVGSIPITVSILNYYRECSQNDNYSYNIHDITGGKSNIQTEAFDRIKLIIGEKWRIWVLHDKIFNYSIHKKFEAHLDFFLDIPLEPAVYNWEKSWVIIGLQNQQHYNFE